MSKKQIVSGKKKLKYLGQMTLLKVLYRLTPHSEWVLFHLGNAYAEHDQPEKAIPFWALACSYASTSRPAALRNLGTTLLQLNRPIEAIAPLQKLAAATNQADSYALLGSAHRQAKQLPEAIVAYEESLSCQPENDAIRFTLALLLEQTKQPKRALTHYLQITDPSLHSRVEARCEKLGYFYPKNHRHND